MLNKAKQAAGGERLLAERTPLRNCIMAHVNFPLHFRLSYIGHNDPLGFHSNQSAIQEQKRLAFVKVFHFSGLTLDYVQTSASAPLLSGSCRLIPAMLIPDSSLDAMEGKENTCLEDVLSVRLVILTILPVISLLLVELTF